MSLGVPRPQSSDLRHAFDEKRAGGRVERDRDGRQEPVRLRVRVRQITRRRPRIHHHRVAALRAYNRGAEKLTR